MKKKVFAILTVLCLVLTIVPIAVFAANTTVNDTSTLKTAIQAGGEVTLGADITLTEKIEIPAGKTVTLDLNGKTLTGASNQDVLSNKGMLTVTGTGTVKAQGTGGAVVNYTGGTANLNGGTYTGEKWYTLKNMGTMTIAEGASVSTSDAANVSSLIANGWYGNKSNNDRNQECPSDGTTANLTISGGSFTGNQKTLNTVKNDDCGSLTITGGTFSNTTGPSVLNWHQATISGGTFKAENSAVLANGYLGERDKGELTVTGGTFSSKDANTPLFAIGQGSTSGGKLTVNGGDFTGKFVVPEYKKDENTAAAQYDISVESGTFSSAVPVANIAQGKTAASKNDVAFYIGSSEQVAANLATAQTGDTVTVTQGDLAVANVPTGVTVKNEGTGAVTVNNVSVPQNGQVVAHQHNAVYTEAKAPTATEAGNLAYWYCADCGKYFTDQALTTEVPFDSLVLAATGETTPEQEQKPAENLNSPATGDVTFITVALLTVLAGATLTGVAITAKRKA